MSTRHTHTVATLDVTAATYDEIARQLREAGYNHVFLDDGTIDMTGIGLEIVTAAPGLGAVRENRRELASVLPPTLPKRELSNKPVLVLDHGTVRFEAKVCQHCYQNVPAEGRLVFDTRNGRGHVVEGELAYDLWKYLSEHSADPDVFLPGHG